ncbi:uncharacterized protein BP5553_06451 [Venustampulla echinocandica]|uniref:Uncharacterized protein n=1 Tax=Venustampulla echinocandica TaxID=2656787 RepID=A0A370TJZ4_9HELO|nr:uncharacterized protein BP5553_06451 [Venustampulla echinocandica]RDL35839.1 hypothetical protein BP5553_06451 [Venustampulla echinocandica]
MARLDIHFDDVDDRMAKKMIAYVDDDNNESRTGTLDLPRDDGEPWGLDDSEVSRVVHLVAYQIGRLADSVPIDHFSNSTLPSAFLDAKEELKQLLGIVFGDDIEKKSKAVFTETMDSKALATLHASLFRALFSAAVQQWVFYSRISDIPSIKAVSFDVQQKVILAKYGFSTLRNIHRATWVSLMYENPEQIRHVFTSEAADLTNRFLTTLEPLIVPVDESKHTPAIDDWISSTRDGQPGHRVVLQIFTASLKLKARLPLTEQYYEFLSPVLGTSFSRDLMAVDGEDVMDMDIADDSISQFSIMPAIIEYPMSVFITETEDEAALFGPHNFVRATATEREKGRVVCPAILTLQ